MTEEKYAEIVNKVIETINDGIVLMTTDEELDYKHRIIDDLKQWVNNFKGGRK